MVIRVEKTDPIFSAVCYSMGSGRAQAGGWPVSPRFLGVTKLDPSPFPGLSCNTPGVTKCESWRYFSVHAHLVHTCVSPSCAKTSALAESFHFLNLSCAQNDRSAHSHILPNKLDCAVAIS